jgi:site-specific recombinase XerD
MTALLVPTPQNLLEPIQPIAPFIQGKRSPKTRRAYMSDLELFLKELAFQSPQELLDTTPEQVAAYRDKLIEGGQSPATIARKLSTLRSFFSYYSLLRLSRFHQEHRH